MGEVAAAMEGELLTNGARAAELVSGFSIDTRTLAPGDLFIALRGERLDGHDYVSTALQAGACGVVVHEASAAPSAGPEWRAPLVIRVADTTLALQRLGRSVRRQSRARVVAITGSAGKTTTKEIAAEFLAARFRVFRNKGNLNNHIGVPLSLLDLRLGPEIAVIEFGMNHAGEIRTLVGIAEPDVRVWTNVAEAHAGFFASIEEIADAKAEILENASRSMLLVANADDPLVMTRSKRFVGRVMTFGFDASADVRASGIRDRGLDGMSALLTTPVGSAEIEIPLMGRGNLANVLAATAVAVSFEIPLPTIVERAARVAPVSRRGEIHRLRGGVVVLDDSYNASPRAVEGSLDVLLAAREGVRRVAFLGEMLELGEHANALHERTGRVAAGVDSLVTIGGEPARRLGLAAVAAGLPEHALVHCATSEEAAELAPALVKPGDIVLVKGSRGIRTDRVVERLKADLG
ncbi:MAG: UDP-N-acetylmuramoyl-tripeptide--D-alanyl-D-alanine ligase [Acidobacteria bacterium]|nr:UDP-N-acetylmuramoyl-tripeptide--D-alanyl-D-alanine ligase [Acidobacteriota bacterium]